MQTALRVHAVTTMWRLSLVPCREDANFQRNSHCDTTDLPWEDLCKAPCQHEREGTHTRHPMPSDPSEKTFVWRAAAVVGAPANKLSRGSPRAKSCATNRLLPLHLCSLVLTSFLHDVPSLTRLCIGHWGGFARSSDFQRVVLCESASTNVL